MKKKENLDIGNLIWIYRLKKGISQMELGERIGVSYQQIQKYEKGVSSLSIERLMQISKELEIPIKNFLEKDSYSVSEPTQKYKGLTPEEEELLHIFRRLKSKTLRRALLDFLKEMAGNKSCFIRQINPLELSWKISYPVT